MAEPISPFKAPPTPPELLTLPKDFKREHQQWTERNVRWIESLIREIATIWQKLRLALNDVNTRVDGLDDRVDGLDARVKDIYTFPYQGTLSPGVIGLPLRIVADSRLVEAFGSLDEVATGADVQVKILKNGTAIAELIIGQGALTGILPLDEALTKDTDRLQPEIIQVGSSDKGRNLVVQFRAR